MGVLCEDEGLQHMSQSISETDTVRDTSGQFYGALAEDVEFGATGAQRRVPRIFQGYFSIALGHSVAFEVDYNRDVKRQPQLLRR